MKKSNLLILFLLIFSLATQAQITVIPKAGFTINRFRTSQIVDPNNNSKILVDYNSVNGFMAGAGIMLPVSSSGLFALQPELVFVQKGYQVESAQNQLTIKGREIHNYVELPLLARLNFGDEKFNVFTVIGPSAGYLLGGSYFSEVRQSGDMERLEGQLRFGEKPANYSGSDYYYTSDEINRLDLGLQIGGGISAAAGPGRLQLELRYGFGFTDVLNTSSMNVTNLYTSNRTIAVSVGYGLPLSKK